MYLLKFLFFIFVLLQSKAFSLDETYILTPRVGAELDNYEIKYFGLFRQVSDIKSAIILKESYDVFKAVLSFFPEKSKTDTTIILNKHLIDQFTFYIENFENLYKMNNHPYFQDSILWKYIQTRHRYFPTKIPWMDFNQKVYNHQLLFIDSSFIVLWTSDSDYHYDSLDQNIKILFYNQIFTLSGYDIKGNQDFYNMACEEIHNKLSFLNYYNDNAVYPKDLLNYIQTNKDKFMGQPFIDTSNIYRPQAIRKYLNYIVIGYDFNDLDFESNNKVILTTTSNLYGDEKNENFLVELPVKSETVFFETNFYLLPLYIYGTYDIYPRTSIKSNVDFIIDISSYGLGLKYHFDYYVFMKKRYLKFFHNKKISIELAVGAVFRKLDITDKIRRKLYNTDYHGFPYSTNSDAKDMGLNFGLGLNLSIIDGLYFNSKLQYYYSLRPEKIDFFNPLEWESYLGRKYSQKTKTDINLDTFIFSIGLSYGLDSIFFLY